VVVVLAADSFWEDREVVDSGAGGCNSLERRVAVARHRLAEVNVRIVCRGKYEECTGGGPPRVLGINQVLG